MKLKTLYRPLLGMLRTFRQRRKPAASSAHDSPGVVLTSATERELAGGAADSRPPPTSCGQESNNPLITKSEGTQLDRPTIPLIVHGFRSIIRSVTELSKTSKRGEFVQADTPEPVFSGDSLATFHSHPSVFSLPSVTVEPGTPRFHAKTILTCEPATNLYTPSGGSKVLVDAVQDIPDISLQVPPTHSNPIVPPSNHDQNEPDRSIHCLSTRSTPGDPATPNNGGQTPDDSSTTQFISHDRNDSMQTSGGPVNSDYLIDFLDCGVGQSPSTPFSEGQLKMPSNDIGLHSLLTHAFGQSVSFNDSEIPLSSITQSSHQLKLNRFSRLMPLPPVISIHPDDLGTPPNGAAGGPSQLELNWFPALSTPLPRALPVVSPSSHIESIPSASTVDGSNHNSSSQTGDCPGLGLTILPSDVQDENPSNRSLLPNIGISTTVTADWDFASIQAWVDGLNSSTQSTPNGSVNSLGNDDPDSVLCSMLMQPSGHPSRSVALSSDSQTLLAPRSTPLPPMIPVHLTDLTASTTDSPSQLELNGFTSPSPPPLRALPESSSPGRALAIHTLDTDTDSFSQIGGGFGLGLTLDESPSGCPIHSGFTPLSAIYLATPTIPYQDTDTLVSLHGGEPNYSDGDCFAPETISITSNVLTEDSSDSCNANTPTMITIGSDIDNNQDQVNKLKMSRHRNGHHFGLVLDIDVDANMHHLDHFWEDLLEDGGECLRLCNSLEIILPNGVIRPSDGCAAKDLCTRLQSSLTTIQQFSWKGSAHNLTHPWNWREILPLQNLTSLKLDCQLSIDDGADILRQCSVLTDCQLVLGAVSSTAVIHNFLHPTLRRLTISSSVDLSSFFGLVEMQKLKHIDLRLTRAAIQERRIQEYRICWENIQRFDLHGHIAEEEIREIRAGCHEQLVSHQYIHPPDLS